MNPHRMDNAADKGSDCPLNACWCEQVSSCQCILHLGYSDLKYTMPFQCSSLVVSLTLRLYIGFYFVNKYSRKR